MTFRPGTLRGLRQCASPRGTFTVLALDHRQNLRRELRLPAAAAAGSQGRGASTPAGGRGACRRAGGGKLPGEERRRVVIETARRLTAIGGDILKAEFPYDAAVADEERWREGGAALTAAPRVPWGPPWGDGQSAGRHEAAGRRLVPGVLSVAPPVDLGLLVVGEINPDIIVAGAHAQPRFGQTERYVRSIRLVVGSSSVITACGAMRLGLRTAFVGVVGDDLFGGFMLDEMRTRGIDMRACRIDPELPTGVTVVLDTGADRAILTAPGAMASLHAEEVPRALLMRARHLHVGSWFLQDRLRPGLPGLFAAAHAEGLTTSLDPGWDPAEEWQGLQDILALTDVFLPNTAEARAIGGTSDVAAAAQAIRGVGPEGMTVGVEPGAPADSDLQRLLEGARAAILAAVRYLQV